MPILSDALDGRGRTAGNMFQITWRGFTMKRDAYRFLGLKDHRLSNMKILDQAETEIPDQQKKSKTYEGQAISHDLFLANPERQYQEPKRVGSSGFSVGVISK